MTVWTTRQRHSSTLGATDPSPCLGRNVLAEVARRVSGHCQAVPAGHDTKERSTNVKNITYRACAMTGLQPRRLAGMAPE
eukprot:9714425-Alexandrium_andersonii.AAC.1